jgi:hypothetical protein
MWVTIHASVKGNGNVNESPLGVRGHVQAIRAKGLKSGDS